MVTKIHNKKKQFIHKIINFLDIYFDYEIHRSLLNAFEKFSASLTINHV